MGGHEDPDNGQEIEHLDEEETADAEEEEGIEGEAWCLLVLIGAEEDDGGDGDAQLDDDGREGTKEEARGTGQGQERTGDHARANAQERIGVAELDGEIGGDCKEEELQPPAMRDKP